MEKEKRPDQCQAFVSYVISRMENDNGMRARLRRADNQATEYQSWKYLAPFGVNLERDRERKAFATVAAALARAKPKADGALGIGRAIALCYDNGSENHQAEARLRRLLACSSTEEACDILRTLLKLIDSRVKAVCYSRLLRDLLYFSEKTKARWAQDFFSSYTSEASKGE
jgi:CRISPR system Cascade subunit CasB